ncbi:MAG: threo-3-hydroxy-L-aspartate ammonia-lyase [Candidatus Nanopelagicales bacterium]|jgi:threo-3-hydroxy-L-aspartate ammonia-lyase|nr:threo-3-hydroxy-L-aspartate ammonia-lyase [Candidatus Nanopelagicales bacterium]MDP4715271.1 threo-3-hydroxy-L-aspartate ammonia-lyase [Candidatus Nanopelagicales bacterium]MDP4907033.1 threo-3-hydroxy-L-aspartate ammonia-lyase [Candidatus Nanopelagicales bacterium]MDP5095171.1 threo-3-hydroxy-L-aspartate ammonia-lyase [Candidatus Nanopelagicales bacterium]
MTPTFADVEVAADRIAGVAHRTPVMRSRLLDEMTGARLFFKCENLQRAGVFKFRGAYNAVSALPADVRARGVVTYSSGNHAQAISLAARLHGVPATIVMPLDAPEVKVAATAGYGAQIVRYDRYTQDYAAIAACLADEQGATVIPPCDHPDIIAGQGTATRELMEDVGDLGALFVPVGGGGLFSGSVVSAQAMQPGCRLYGVEPEAGNDGQQSLAQGRIVTIDAPQTIADGAQTRFLDPLPFEILLDARPTMLTASDDELVETMRLLASLMKIIVEPTGCLGLAAVRQMADQLAGQRVGIILSGGNVDLARFADLINPTAVERT